ncbi:MAG: asparaginase [Candidatus Riflebacteria bacterium]|nr:asparaginase [Candidatus Riflebacteria bacterium]
MKNKNERLSILLVSTGGTITMVRHGKTGLVPCSDANMLLERVPEIRELADVDLLPLANIDSSNVEPHLWIELGRAIYERLDQYDGFVVTHGTDTLAYTAAGLSFMLQNLNKPVILTGAQVPLEEIGSDGRTNLINAFRVACSDIADVAVVFGSLVIRGCRTKKTSAFDLQAFTSANAEPMGTIGLSIKFVSGLRRRARRNTLFMPYLEPSVTMISVYPGMKPGVLTWLAENHAGIVIEGYGAGNIPTEGRLSLVPAIRSAIDHGISIVVCTQCLVGSTEMELYKVGKTALDAGAIPAMDMTPETTLVKLMWVLGQKRDQHFVASLMQKSLIGELHS